MEDGEVGEVLEVEEGVSVAEGSQEEEVAGPEL